MPACTKVVLLLRQANGKVESDHNITLIDLLGLDTLELVL